MAAVLKLNKFWEKKLAGGARNSVNWAKAGPEMYKSIQALAKNRDHRWKDAASRQVDIEAFHVERAKHPSVLSEVLMVNVGAMTRTSQVLATDLTPSLVLQAGTNCIADPGRKNAWNFHTQEAILESLEKKAPRMMQGYAVANLGLEMAGDTFLYAASGDIPVVESYPFWPMPRFEVAKKAYTPSLRVVSQEDFAIVTVPTTFMMFVDSEEEILQGAMAAPNAAVILLTGGSKMKTLMSLEKKLEDEKYSPMANEEALWKLIAKKWGVKVVKRGEMIILWKKEKIFTAANWWWNDTNQQKEEGFSMILKVLNRKRPLRVGFDPKVNDILKDLVDNFDERRKYTQEIANALSERKEAIAVEQPQTHGLTKLEKGQFMMNLSEASSLPEDQKAEARKELWSQRNAKIVSKITEIRKQLFTRNNEEPSALNNYMQHVLKDDKLTYFGPLRATTTEEGNNFFGHEAVLASILLQERKSKCSLSRKERLRWVKESMKAQPPEVPLEQLQEIATMIFGTYKFDDSCVGWDTIDLRGLMGSCEHHAKQHFKAEDDPKDPSNGHQPKCDTCTNIKTAIMAILGIIIDPQGRAAAESLALLRAATLLKGTTKPLLLRLISNMGQIQKSLGRVVSKEMERHIKKMSPWQCGGRKCDQGSANIYLRKKVMRGYRHTIKIDVADAFMQVNPWLVIQILEEYAPIAGPLLAYLRKLQAFMQLDPATNEMKMIHFITGVLQGSPEAQYTFLILLEILFRDFKFKKNIIAQVDDFVIVAETAEEAEMVMEEVKKVLAKAGLYLNESKTKRLTWAEGAKEVVYDFNGMMIGPCFSLIYNYRALDEIHRDRFNNIQEYFDLQMLEIMLYFELRVEPAYDQRARTCNLYLEQDEWDFIQHKRAILSFLLGTPVPLTAALVWYFDKGGDLTSTISQVQHIADIERAKSDIIHKSSTTASMAPAVFRRPRQDGDRAAMLNKAMFRKNLIGWLIVQKQTKVKRTIGSLEDFLFEERNAQHIDSLKLTLLTEYKSSKEGGEPPERKNEEKVITFMAPSIPEKNDDFKYFNLKVKDEGVSPWVAPEFPKEQLPKYEELCKEQENILKKMGAEIPRKLIELLNCKKNNQEEGSLGKRAMKGAQLQRQTLFNLSKSESDSLIIEIRASEQITGIDRVRHGVARIAKTPAKAEEQEVEIFEVKDEHLKSKFKARETALEAENQLLQQMVRGKNQLLKRQQNEDEASSSKKVKEDVESLKGNANAAKAIGFLTRNHMMESHKIVKPLAINDFDALLASREILKKGLSGQIQPQNTRDEEMRRNSFKKPPTTAKTGRFDFSDLAGSSNSKLLAELERIHDNR